MKELSRFLNVSVLAGFYAFACLAVASTDPSTPTNLQPFDTTIIWANKEQGLTAFLPQAVLQGADIDDLPLDRYQKEDLERELQERRVRAVGCRQNPPLPGQGEAPDAVGFQEYLSRMPATFVGTVVSVQSGWATGRRSVAELIFIKVEEALSENRAGAGVQGIESIAIIVLGGKVIIGDQAFCRDRPSEFFFPREGDRVLVGGRLLDPDQGHFAIGAIFQIRGTEVTAQPYADLLEDTTGSSLERVRLYVGTGGTSNTPEQISNDGPPSSRSPRH